MSWSSKTTTGVIMAAAAAIVYFSPALAVENPQSGSASVTATVPQTNPPDIPVLISPENGSTISTRAPNFIFDPSLGETSVTHYQLWLDGKKNTDHIPQSYTTIAAQALSALTEGQHTWMIKAIGSNTLSRDSATWVFTIDVTAPLILVSQVAEHDTNLSSLDHSTIPSGLTFTTSQRQPGFAGQSEANATLTISLVGPKSVNFSTLVAADGSFSLAPPYALPPGSYTVTVSSSDTPGNTATLPPFTLEISQAYPPIVISLPSPLPQITLPGLPFLPRPSLPTLPEILQAFPLAPARAAFIFYLPWIIILLLLWQIYLLRKRQPNPSLIPLWLADLILLYLALTRPHFITIGLTFLATFLIAWLIRTYSKDIKRYQS
ncbi:TPA: hypothetical protein DCK82_05625 [Candidatus Beckwithbacteria bacterium]|nr:hypothetical protein [Candidatus Beckwithbacteria bacterium]